jgi:hypothetical protein
VLAHGGRLSPAKKRREKEVLEHRGAEANKMRSRIRGTVERRGVVHGAKLSGELSRAPASDSRGRGPYHSKPRRARDA